MGGADIDPYAQYDRLRDAFRFAEWSEDEFNNRGLFSDYFLKLRLPDDKLFPVWNTDIRPAQRELLRAFDQTHDVAQLIGPVLKALGFEAETLPEADFRLRPMGAPKDAPACAVLLAYPWDRPLDRQDDRNHDRADHVPGIRVVRALEQEKAPWGILTNGKDWRLYCAAAHSRASNYYEVELPDALGRDDLSALRYF